MRDPSGSRPVRREIIATVAVFSTGLAILLLVAEAKGGQTARVNPTVPTFIDVGTALACYLVLRPAYVAWRSEHPTVRPSSWVSGIGIALVFSLVTVIASAILHEIALGVGLLLGVSGDSP